MFERGIIVSLSVFPALRRICARSLCGRVTTDRPSTASNWSPGWIWPLRAAGLPLRTVTNLWHTRDEATGREREINLIKVCYCSKCFCWAPSNHIKIETLFHIFSHSRTCSFRTNLKEQSCYNNKLANLWSLFEPKSTTIVTVMSSLFCSSLTVLLGFKDLAYYFFTLCS